ncbi:MAG TPA: RlmE family RNA methyltransferase [Dongiaceae bacterium]|nr:RlmE family RNA methyltransferase [Dongiaceae bacterium]
MTRRGRDGGRTGGGKGAGGRGLAVRVTTAAKRRPSSTRWLARQLNDPYVAEAQRLGYRSRAAFKLEQLDDRFRILGAGKRVVDLGAAPGGWTQVAVQRVAPPGGAVGRVVAIDLLPMDPVPGAIVLRHDFLAPDAPALIATALGGRADVVLSDMAAPATGHAGTDHLRVMALAEAAYAFAAAALAPGGAFVVKVLRGGAEAELLAALKRDFVVVRHVKPPASRSDSAEIYLVATGFRGG